MTVQTSTFREDPLTKLDIDPGYFCKYLRDQMALHMIEQSGCYNICDVGCDRGHIYSILGSRKYEFSYLGIDIDTSRFVHDSDSTRIKLRSVKDDSETLNIVGNLTHYSFPTRVLYPMQQEFQVNSNNSQNNYYVENNKGTAILLLDVIEHMSKYENGLELISQSIYALRSPDMRRGGEKEKNLLLISTPNRQSRNPHQVNWPKYHQFEYSLNELLDYLNDRHGINEKNGKCLVYGWSMSNDTYRAIMDQTHIGAKDIPQEIDRVFTALQFPEYSRDILIKIEI